MAEAPRLVALALTSSYPGKFVFHCHVLGHEAVGMMATVVVNQ